MQNLEQIRASHALGRASDLDKRVINKIPAMIVANGLLAAAAFATDGESRREMRKAMDAVADHLKQRALTGGNTSKEMITDLTTKDSGDLQRATAKALAYLGYLKRFATKGGDDSED